MLKCCSEDEDGVDYEPVWIYYSFLKIIFKIVSKKNYVGMIDMRF
jgi:hypothetical protein